MPITSPGNDDDTGENHQPTLRKNTAEPVEQTLKQNRYLPKRSEIRMDMAGELREIVDETDNRPMRVLDYRTPAEAFADELLELQDQQGCCTSK